VNLQHEGQVIDGIADIAGYQLSVQCAALRACHARVVLATSCDASAGTACVLAGGITTFWVQVIELWLLYNINWRWLIVFLTAYAGAHRLARGGHCTRR
jgi:hypothetical protein